MQWDRFWDAGIEIEGNHTIATAVNASLYYIYASTNEFVQWGVSAGGVANDAYHGHTFWGQETWVMPSIVLLRPKMAKQMMVYRLQRTGQAARRAEAFGFEGFFFPWESAYTGIGCDQFPNPEGWFEQHITGDIANAMKLTYNAIHDNEFLSEVAWPVVKGACDFWTCRFTRTEPSCSNHNLRHGVNTAGTNCGCKQGSGNYTIWNVQPPDETALIVNDSAYTNGVAATALMFCSEAAHALNKTASSWWSEIASNLYLPLSDKLYDGGSVHPEFKGYWGEKINQADVALLQYPLGFSMPNNIAKNDLLYYYPRTRQNGYFTGDSAYSIAWLALGNDTEANDILKAAYAHIDMQHYFVWKETLTGGHLNFIAGAGGFLQNLVNGYMNLRMNEPGILSFVNTPLLPPGNITQIKLRKFRVSETPFSMTYDGDKLCMKSEVDSAVVHNYRSKCGGTLYAILRSSQGLVSTLFKLSGTEQCVKYQTGLAIADQCVVHS
eukprot:gb/GECG01004880.1/.p1 GENE.gb/GECG01004880.1/~~gb/GECG01004880.1/.p1  ORF type:complete len:494 (+),score=46.54 gb/GECG01004880.1/:1-1482(+)